MSVLTLPESVTVEVVKKIPEKDRIVMVLIPDFEGLSFIGGDWRFVQTDELTEELNAVSYYGPVFFLNEEGEKELELLIRDTRYVCTVDITSLEVGDTITFVNSESLLAKLSDLSFSSIELTPEFDPDEAEYSGETYLTTDTITITVPDEETAVIMSVGDTPVELTQDGTEYTGSVTLEQGENEITVFSEYGDFTNTYTVTVTVGADPHLKNLTISGVTLTPSFDPDVTEYTGETETETGSLYYEADPNAVVTVTLNDTEVEGGNLTFTEGDNEVIITVEGIETVVYSFYITYTVPLYYTDDSELLLSYRDNISLSIYNEGSDTPLRTSVGSIIWKPSDGANQYVLMSAASIMTLVSKINQAPQLKVNKNFESLYSRLYKPTLEQPVFVFTKDSTIYSDYDVYYLNSVPSVFDSIVLKLETAEKTASYSLRFVVS